MSNRLNIDKLPTPSWYERIELSTLWSIDHHFLVVIQRASARTLQTTAKHCRPDKTTLQGYLPIFDGPRGNVTIDSCVRPELCVVLGKARRQAKRRIVVASTGFGNQLNSGVRARRTDPDHDGLGEPISCSLYRLISYRYDLSGIDRAELIQSDYSTILASDRKIQCRSPGWHRRKHRHATTSDQTDAEQASEAFHCSPHYSHS